MTPVFDLAAPERLVDPAVASEYARGWAEIVGAVPAETPERLSSPTARRSIVPGQDRVLISYPKIASHRDLTLQGREVPSIWATPC